MSSGIKLKFEDIKKDFELAGFIVQSTEILNNSSLIKAICPKNHLGWITVANFRRGRRCGECYRSRGNKRIIANHRALINISSNGLIAENIEIYEREILSKSGIYEILCLINGRRYIGSTEDKNGFLGRWRNHISDLRNSSHSNQFLQNSWNKYGESNFKFKILEFTKPSHRLMREQWWMDLYGSYLRPNGFNISETASGCTNRDYLIENRKQRSEKINAAILECRSKELYVNLSNVAKLSGIDRGIVSDYIKEHGIILEDFGKYRR